MFDVIVLRSAGDLQSDHYLVVGKVCNRFGTSSPTRPYGVRVEKLKVKRNGDMFERDIWET